VHRFALHRIRETQSGAVDMNTPARILVADDNETNRDILATRLEANGYEVLHAADGEEALAVTRDKRPDLILLDIMMPKLDGIEVCKRVKADATLPFTPIVLVTAKADSGDVVEGLDAGADEYLTKPVDQKALVARVKALLRIKERHDAAAPKAEAAPANGADLFISYSQKDLAAIKSLATILQQDGWSLWFDQKLRAGATFDRVIEQALTDARAVIVAWSKNSVNSDWVRAEAAFALESAKLFPVRLDDTPLPLRFIHVHTLNLSGWDGSASHHGLQALLAHLHEAIGKPGGGGS
jgi:DNA-binding response OmpR family regulator